MTTLDLLRLVEERLAQRGGRLVLADHGLDEDDTWHRCRQIGASLVSTVGHHGVTDVAAYAVRYGLLLGLEAAVRPSALSGEESPAGNAASAPGANGAVGTPSRTPVEVRASAASQPAPARLERGAGEAPPGEEAPTPAATHSAEPR